jgi:hypothetical protein
MTLNWLSISTANLSENAIKYPIFIYFVDVILLICHFF